MEHTKSTKPGHIRYGYSIIKFLKTFLIGNKTNNDLFIAINKKNGIPANSTLKNAFNPNKYKITINIVQCLLVFVLKKQNEKNKEARGILVSLNNLLARLNWEDFTKADKDSILKTLDAISDFKFDFFKVNNVDIVLFKGSLTESTNKTILSYGGQKIILNNIIEDILNLKKEIQFKKVEKTKGSKMDICSQIEYYPEKEQHILPHFIGREFVFKAIDEFIAKNGKGYFFLKADAGIGKTSFAVKLVNKRGYPFHIINPHRNNTGNSVKDFIKNICAQLICHNNLPIKEFPEDYDKDGSFLQLILRQVSEKLRIDEKLIIVVDGLDELKQEELIFFAKESILYLPEILPSNIFFILTMRKIDKGFKGVKLPKKGEYKDFIIEGKERDNIDDAREYIEQNLKKTEIQKYLEKHNISQKKFLNDLENKSEGNFMYLNYVLKEIADGDYKDTTLSKLPQGLDGYYKEHMERMMTKADGISNDVKLKTIYVLANIESPMSRKDLTEIIQSDTEKVSHKEVQEIIDNWRQFLTPSWDEEGIENFTFYHKSFLDFLASDDIIDTIGDDYPKIAQRVELNFYDQNIDDFLEEDDTI